MKIPGPHLNIKTVFPGVGISTVIYDGRQTVSSL